MVKTDRTANKQAFCFVLFTSCLNLLGWLSPALFSWLPQKRTEKGSAPHSSHHLYGCPIDHMAKNALKTFLQTYKPKGFILVGRLNWFMGTAFQVFLRMHTSVANLVMYSRKSPEEEASLCLRYSHFAVDIWYAFNAPALISVCRQVFMCVSRHSPLLSTNLCAVVCACLGQRLWTLQQLTLQAFPPSAPRFEPLVKDFTRSYSITKRVRTHFSSIQGSSPFCPHHLPRELPEGRGDVQDRGGKRSHTSGKIFLGENDRRQNFRLFFFLTNISKFPSIILLYIIIRRMSIIHVVKVAIFALILSEDIVVASTGGLQSGLHRPRTNTRARRHNISKRSRVCLWRLSPLL
ncbi:hypothetical protein VP01_595g2 [Puccinia sorghi]|uniref:Uncharacterized protein n=1 Tax=Puccinia sorghi TaxID=27349 RepID=A0A0L6UHL8_9BASI|nr:hypothetical protein VP01_595g2 [Puccinia sorghi]